MFDGCCGGVTDIDVDVGLGYMIVKSAFQTLYFLDVGMPAIGSVVYRRVTVLTRSSTIRIGLRIASQTDGNRNSETRDPARH